MPDFGVEFHDGGAEGVVAGDLDVDGVGAAFVGGIGGSWEGAFEVGEVGFVGGGDGDAGLGVAFYVCYFFGDAPGAVGGHGCVCLWAYAFMCVWPCRERNT